MKEYEKAKIEIIRFDKNDIVVASSCNETPGHGYGDKNHNHKHWKDFND